MKRLLQAALIGALALISPLGASCAAVLSALPKVVAAVTDAAQILDAIENFSDRFFLAAPDEANERKVRASIDRARLALNAALRATQGAENLSQDALAAAFADFRAAYKDLLALTEPMGVKQAAPGAEQLMAATPGGLTVPEPMALSLGTTD